MFIKAGITGTLQAGGPTFTAEYLVIAGGGGGGGMAGGGAGGYRTATDFSIALGTPYTVTVGAGGSGAANGSFRGNNGAASIFGSVSSAGGGAGGAFSNTLGAGVDGGSGGGGGTASSSPFAGQAGGNGNVPVVSPSQGNDGGDGVTGGTAGGGGGGASASGANAITNTGGAGGSGAESLITGSSAYRAGGGGGGGLSAFGAGGVGGGGSGASNSPTLASTSGIASTGGGGGGGYNTVGGSGGSGVVIIRVPSQVVAEFSAGVVYNYIPQDDFNVYEITAAGVSDTVTFSTGGALATVDDSLRFNDDDSAYLTRTPTVAGNRKTWTWSGWVKRGDIGGSKKLFNSVTGFTQTDILWLDGELIYIDYAGTPRAGAETSALFRDPSAWYHIVVAVDTTQAVASERLKFYVNGKSYSYVTRSGYPSAAPALNYSTQINNTLPHYVGGDTSYFDGYMADVYLIDGQALDPSRFGKQDADGVWQPISYTGTYGTNGFHLDFADNSTAAALGTDVSGNSNDWTPSGITTDDQVSDTPTVNYATWNPLVKADNVSVFADGNLKAGTSSSAWRSTLSTFAMSSGKWYWEVTGFNATTAWYMVGIGDKNTNLASYLGVDANSYGYFGNTGNKYYNGGLPAYGASYSGGDVIGIAFDADIGSLTFYKNNISQGVAFTGIPAGEYFPAACSYGTAATSNFGQRPFAYTPPVGFQALNSANLPAPVITDGKEHFQPVLYTGNGTSQTVRGLEFQPDMVWIKCRNVAFDHQLHDAVRGTGSTLFPNLTQAQGAYNTLTAFNSNGFTVDGSTYAGTNSSGNTFVAWNWNAGGSTVTNTDGSITSQVRANTDAGFSIVSWTGNGTVGHGLTQAPDVYFMKVRSATTNWPFLYTVVNGSLDYMLLNLSNAAGNASQAAPTSSLLTIPSADVAGGATAIAYCFHSVDGFSKFGSYTGNGSADGPFVYTGFRPAFVLVKNYVSAGVAWVIHDTQRNHNNIVDKYLRPDTVDVEGTLDSIDILSNGFKVRTTNATWNGAGMIYMAFAENPFKTARAR